jgi:chaperonin GroEL
MAADVRTRTFAAVGDGTTTALVLAQWIYVEGMTLVNAGASPTDVVQDIDAAVAVVVQELSRHSVPVRTRSEMVAVATTSAGGDQAIGGMIVDAVERVGKAVVTLPATGSLETSLEFVSGIRFERGYLSPYFVTNSERAEAVLEHVRVLILPGEVPNIRDLSPLLEQVAKAGTPLLVIAEIEGEALATLVAN